MTSKNGQILFCLYTAIFLYNRMQSKHIQTKCEHSRRNSYRLQLSQFIGTPCILCSGFVYKQKIIPVLHADIEVANRRETIIPIS